MRVSSCLRFVVLGSAFVLNACGGKVDAPGAATSGPSGRLTPALPITPYVVHTNESLGVPSFAWIGNQALGPIKLPKGATAVDVAWGTLNAVAPSYKLSPAAVAGARIGAVHDVGRGGAVIARFDQNVDGVDVFGASLNVAMKADLQPVAVTGSLAPSTKILWAKGWTLDARAAVSAAYKEMSGNLVSTAGMFAAGSDAAGHDRFDFTVGNGGAVQFAHARAKRVWFPEESGIVPSWYVEIDLAGNRSVESKMVSFVVHAGQGTLLFQNDLMASDSYKYRVWADNSGPKGLAPLDSPYGNGLTPNAPGAFVAGATAPPYLFPSLVTLQNVPFSQNDPWLPPAATELNGNNAWAYSDVSDPDGYTPMSNDLLVTPTSAGAFDRIWDPSSLPNATPSNVQAVTTDLFFVVNYMHDLFYDSGWNEASRNPQTNNFGRGGVGGDQIHAESQDSSGLDNANASTPADGNSPRIQMYLWDLATAKVTINAPASIAGDIRPAGGSNFGPAVYSRTNDIVKYLDVTPSMGLANSSHACNSNGGASNAAALAGKFCLVDRGGTCSSTEKAKNCLAAGATGLIFANDAEAIVGLGVVDASLADFPGLSIPKSSADAIKTALGTGVVNITMIRTAPDRDGSVDGTIMSHEWGHILSNRLIGNANGLSNNQGRSMGEGWSDFVALLTYIRPTDLNVPSNANWNGAYPMGTYALGATANDIYYGIRRYPYSYDMATRDPLTFKHIMNGVALPVSPAPIAGADGASNSEVHNSGEVWCVMLWDAYVGLLRDTGNYNYTTASQAMRDYLVASLKVTPNAPTFTEARDAWLAVALANTTKPGDLTTFAQAFARRGMGQGAVAPSRTSSTHAGVVESFAAGGDIALVSVALDDDTTSCDHDHVLDTNEVGTLKVTIRNTGITTLAAGTVTVSSTNGSVTFPSGPSVPLPSVAPFTNAQVTIPVGLAAGLTAIQTIDLKIDMNDPTLVTNFPVPRTKTVAFKGNYDYQPVSSATDDMNAPTSLWNPNADPSLFTGLPWVRVGTQQAGQFGAEWYGQNSPSASDLYLVSPPLSIGATAFSFTFLHSWAFENSKFPPTTGPTIYWDGGVVEISADNGATWVDLDGKFTAGAYTQTLYDGLDATIGPTDNPLQGRKAFGGVSAGFPANITSTVDLGTTYANQTVRIRFRIGTDSGGSNTGWLIDNVAFTGLTNTPFAAQVAHRGLCSNNAPVANAGPPQSVVEGTVGVMLDGSGSSDADVADTLTYQWTQLSGPTVALSSGTAQKPTFTAPQVPATTVLRFQLVVSDGKVSSAPSTVDITVTDIPPPPDMATPPDMVTPNDLSTLPDLAMKADMATTPADMTDAEDMTPAPLPPDMAKKGGGGGGCSTTGDNTPVSTALPLFGLLLAGFAFRRRTRRS
ncbi:MAG: Peptidase, (Fungalysin) family [Myxococcales bacterium]|nr:Peptidase, (Fungalysin) family [Myxococcales bacterium]